METTDQDLVHEEATPKLSDRARFAAMFAASANKFENKVNAPITKVATGKPIFYPEDIATVINPIAKLIRMIFVDKGITEEELKERYNRYYAKQGWHPRAVSTPMHNNLKTIRKTKVTISAFEQVIAALNFHITDIAFTLRDPETGEETTYKYSDAIKFIDHDDADTIEDPNIRPFIVESEDSRISQ
jgi:hypothetical protein